MRAELLQKPGRFILIVILSERSESKDLGTNLTVNDNEMRRFLDSLRSLEMTALVKTMASCFKPISRIFLSRPVSQVIFASKAL